MGMDTDMVIKIKRDRERGDTNKKAIENRMQSNEKELIDGSEASRKNRH
jgi:hypothetical protein